MRYAIAFLLGILCIPHSYAACLIGLIPITEASCIADWYLDEYDPDDSLKEWSSHKGRTIAYGNTIATRLRFDDEAIQILQTHDFGIEVEAVLKGDHRYIELDRIETTFPSNSQVGRDTEVLDYWTNPNNSVVHAAHVLLPQNLEAETDYYVFFYFKENLPEDGVDVVSNIQLTIDLDYLWVAGIVDPVVDTIPWINQFQHYVLETDSHRLFKAYPTGKKGVCWDNKADSYVCNPPEGACFTSVDQSMGDRVASMFLSALGVSTAQAEFCGVIGATEVPIVGSGNRYPPEEGEPTDNISNPDSPVDLKYDVDYYGKDGEKWNTSRPAIPGMKIDVKAHVWADEGDAGNWNPDGSEYIQICYYAELDNGEWIQWAQGQIHIAKLDEGRMDLSETKTYTVPEGYSTLDFRVKIDCTNKVVETDEYNTSEEKHYAISNLKPDFVVSQVYMTDESGTAYYDGATAIEDQEWIPRCVIGSQGSISSPIGIAVEHKMDGEVRDYDHLDSGEPPVGSTTTESVFSKWKLGDTGNRVYTCCVDTGNDVPEMNEGNNCKSMTLNVMPYKSDLVVSNLYLETDAGQTVTPGTFIPKDSIVHPFCEVKNQGNRNVQNGNRLAYYVNQDNYRGDDGLDASDLRVGYTKMEHMIDGFRLGDVGSRTYQCCADYQGDEPELNEGNNCQVMGFTVTNFPTSPDGSFVWSYAGPVSGAHCTQIAESADPDAWSDNYFCSTKEYGIQWSSAGPIGGMRCTQISESADSDSWNDNYLCVPTESPVHFSWGSAGPLSGKQCVQWSEPSDPHTWDDNYLCYEIDAPPPPPPPPPPSYDLAITATGIDGSYALDTGSNFTVQSVVHNYGSGIPNDATVTSTLIHTGGTQYTMGSTTISAGNLPSGAQTQISLNATAPLQEGMYTLKTCVTANLVETNNGNNCLEEGGIEVSVPTQPNPDPPPMTQKEEDDLFLMLLLDD